VERVPLAVAIMSISRGRRSFHRLAGRVGRQRRRTGDPRGVALLAAEAAAQAAHHRVTG
jgi:hypothetical protein